MPRQHRYALLVSFAVVVLLYLAANVTLFLAANSQGEQVLLIVVGVTVPVVWFFLGRKLYAFFLGKPTERRHTFKYR